jgi:hypothetical protein
VRLHAFCGFLRNIHIDVVGKTISLWRPMLHCEPEAQVW